VSETVLIATALAGFSVAFFHAVIPTCSVRCLSGDSRNISAEDSRRYSEARPVKESRAIQMLHLCGAKQRPNLWLPQLIPVLMTFLEK